MTLEKLGLAASVLLASSIASASEPLRQCDADREAGRHLGCLRVESEALAGNLLGDPASRDALVLLPPSYFDREEARYPVAFLLHGLGSRRGAHLEAKPVLQRMLREMKEGALEEAILVVVDGTTRYGGSFYAASTVAGDFERHLVQELVGRVDDLLRTRPKREFRAIGGFSMGGHAAIRLAIRWPGVFGVVGSLSGSPMSLRYRKAHYREALSRHQPPGSLAELDDKLSFERDWSAAAAYALASAYSPNPRRPPLFVDLPFEGRGEGDPVWERWAENDPATLAARHPGALRRLSLLYLDHGEEENDLGTDDFERELVRHGVGHVHHVFRGGHSDLLEERVLRMLRHFHLSWRERLEAPTSASR